MSLAEINAAGAWVTGIVSIVTLAFCFCYFLKKLGESGPGL